MSLLVKTQKAAAAVRAVQISGVGSNVKTLFAGKEDLRRKRRAMDTKVNITSGVSNIKVLLADQNDLRVHEVLKVSASHGFDGCILIHSNSLLLSLGSRDLGSASRESTGRNEKNNNSQQPSSMIALVKCLYRTQSRAKDCKCAATCSLASPKE